MLTNLIENRGKEFSNLLKLGDYLSRSLRENVELFNVESGKVTYLTESGNLLAANYTLRPTLKLTAIEIEDSEILENEDTFTKLTNNKVQSLLCDLLENDYPGAENSFEKILDLFESKLSFERVRDRLHQKAARFGPQTDIMGSDEFQKVFELKESLVTFLKENSNLVNVPEIKNALKLALVVSKSFDLPKLTLEDVKTKGYYEVKQGTNNSIYEHLCKQELITKELLEAKKNFDTAWAHNEDIANLASMIYEKKADIVETKVAEILTNIPYFALATKKQLNKLVSNSLALGELDVPNKDVASFTSKIYEIKKPVKDYIINLLNEKYGINVTNLNEVPTFTNLLKTETVIFTALSKLAPKKSVLKETLLSFAESLKIKNGIESVDLVTFLYEIFEEAGYKSSINETSLMSYLDFNQVAEDLGKIGSILKLIRPLVAGDGGMEGGGDPRVDLGGEEEPGIMDDIPADGEEEDPMAGLEDGPGEDELPVNGLEDEGDIVPNRDEDPQDMANAIKGEHDADPNDVEDDLVPGEEGGAAEEGVPGEEGIPGEEGEEDAEYVDSDELSSLVADIEDLLSSIKGELGDGEEGEEDEELGADNFDGEPLEGKDMDPMEDETVEDDEEGEEEDEGFPAKKFKK